MQIASFNPSLVTPLNINQRTPGIPRNAPVAGISRLGNGILIAPLNSSNIYPSGWPEGDGQLGSAVVTWNPTGATLNTQQRVPGFPLTAPIPGIVQLGTDILIGVPASIQVSNVYPLGIDTLEVLGAMSMLSVTVYPAGISTNEAGGASGGAPNVAGTGLGGGEDFGADAMGAGIALTGISTSEAGGSMGGAANMAGSGLAGGEVLGADSIAANVAAVGLPTNESSGSSGMAPGILPGGISTLETQSAMSETTNLAMVGLKTEEDAGAMSAAQVSSAFPAGIESQEGFGTFFTTIVNAIRSFFKDYRTRSGGGPRGRTG
jgi:hypothetical protein